MQLQQQNLVKTGIDQRLQKLQETVEWQPEAEGKYYPSVKQERWISHQICWKGRDSQHFIHLSLHQHCSTRGAKVQVEINTNSPLLKEELASKYFCNFTPANWWVLTTSTQENLEWLEKLTTPFSEGVIWKNMGQRLQVTSRDNLIICKRKVFSKQSDFWVISPRKW